ncbi:hypothetical protein EMPS_10724 [Entomortierella parvispora]|uniref:Uncharacterized protein n=1 Tax=Entomortierella parvispora TaxID=205924 RepID=A0A9P3HKP8_9FUNG|nr:hypothetical protein EMPS_10724 [Entomortierella parvispora]
MKVSGRVSGLNICWRARSIQSDVVPSFGNPGLSACCPFFGTMMLRRQIHVDIHPFHLYWVASVTSIRSGSTSAFKQSQMGSSPSSPSQHTTLGKRSSPSMSSSNPTETGDSTPNDHASPLSQRGAVAGQEDLM